MKLIDMRGEWARDMLQDMVVQYKEEVVVGYLYEIAGKFELKALCMPVFLRVEIRDIVTGSVNFLYVAIGDSLGGKLQTPFISLQVITQKTFFSKHKVKCSVSFQ